jgi:hypothetical protein
MKPNAWQRGLVAAQAAPRCGAWARRTGLPCQKPAMANGRCRLHGGCSTDPRTAEGLTRCTAAPTKHGRRNAAARATQRRKARSAVAELRRLLAMIQKVDDSGIDPDDMLDLLDAGRHQAE